MALLVFPIPPGVHWRDAMPIVLPGARAEGQTRPALPGNEPARGRSPKPRATPAAARRRVAVLSGFSFAPQPTPQPKAEKPRREPKRHVKNDPRLVAAARELRDRYLERINSEGFLPPSPAGKYDVGRSIGPGVTSHDDEAKLLPAGLATKLLPAA